MKKGSSTEPADNASKLASLVHKNSNFEYEGFYWLKGNIKTIAKELDVTEKTIRRILENNKHNIRYLVKSPKGVPKYVLIRVGTGNCESDHVEFLRKIWVHGLVFFNTALEKNLTFKLENLNNIEFESENKREAYAKRLKKHITRANKGAANLDKVKAGEKISQEVPPQHMGLLRGLVQILKEDAQGVLSCLLTFKGWEQFMSQVKLETEVKNFYLWPNLSIIIKHPHVALDTYLNSLQDEGKITMTDADRILKKILAMQPKAH